MIDKSVFQNILLYMPYMDYYPIYQSMVPEKNRLKWIDCQTNIYKNNITKYFVNDRLHREHDLPAIELIDGTKFWYKNGELHRDNDLPVIENADGTKFWYKNEKYYRDGNRPSVEWANGNKGWHKNGKIYRIKYKNGCEIFYD